MDLFKHFAHIPGIKFFKAGNNVEAFQCLNQALNIDADNVEGLVARGALYANNGGLDKAVEDFEKALLINRSHKNARKYLCETLIAVARNHEDENKVDLAIETYQRILTIVPDHKEALDSIYFLRGKPKDAPLRDDPKQGEKRNKPKLSLDGDKEKSEKKKKKKRRRQSSNSSSGSDSESGDSARKHKKREKERKSRSDSKSPSPLSKRPVSPFSAKMAPSDSGVPAGGVMNMPEEFQKSAPSQLAMNLPLPDLRQDIERLKSQKSEEDDAVQTPGQKPVPPGFPMIDLTKPPPGYVPPAPSYHEQEYDEKVRRFLEETAQGGSSSKKRRSGHSSSSRSERERSRRRSSRRSRSSSRHRKSSRRRSRSREKRKSKGSKGSKSRSRSKDKEKVRKKEHKENNESPEKILIEDDDFAKKLNDHLSSSKKNRSKSRSKGKKSRSRSKGRKSKRKSRSRSREKKKKSRSRSKDRRKRSKSKDNLKTVIQSPIKDVETKKSVFDRLDSGPSRDAKNIQQAKPSSGSGMWIPTGEDSIIEGVKEAINKVEKKERRRSGEDDGKRRRRSGEASKNVEFEIKYDGRTGMYTRVPKEIPNSAKDDIVEVESRIIRKLPDSPATKAPEKKEKSSPHKSRRSKSRDRRRSGRSRSKPRHRSRSRSRRRRSRSRHHQRSRSKSRRREKRRSHSRGGGRRSRSRTKSPGWKERSDYKETQAKLHQSDITDLREETRRLQTEREAVFREKERLLTSASTPASKAKVDTQTSGTAHNNIVVTTKAKN